MILSFYTSILDAQSGNGFRFIKEGNEWKFDITRKWLYNTNPKYNKEVDIEEYDFPRYYFQYIMMLSFKDIEIFQ